MKYTATKTHPYLKEGMNIKIGHYNSYDHENNIVFILGTDVQEYEQKGWIKEVWEEKEFTKSDMQDFAEYCKGINFSSDSTYFIDWLKQRENDT